MKRDMALLCRCMLALSLLLAAAPRLSAAGSPEESAFTAAYSEFVDGFYDFAETDFAEFARKYPSSVRLPEAFLLQAQARFEQSNYVGAVELLTARRPAAGKLADEYVFWLGQSRFFNREYQEAAGAFAELAIAFPDSPRRLESSVTEAAARSMLGQWPQVIELLGQTNSFFQTAIQTNAGNRNVASGFLLLSKAYLGQNDTRSAIGVLESLGKLPLSLTEDWQRQYLLCQILLTNGNTEAALDNATNLLTLANASGQRALQADTAAFQADSLERLGRTNDAIAAYERNLAESVPTARQREALLKIADYALAQNNLAEAARRFEEFLARFPAADSADLALLTLGTVRLRQQQTGSLTNAPSVTATNAPAVTNNFPSALIALQAFTNRFPQSPLLGKALLQLGEYYLLTTNLAEGESVFQRAVASLPLSYEQASGYFKLANTQFARANYAAAATNYQAIVDKFSSLAEVRTNLFEPALYQQIRACLLAGKSAVALNALSNLTNSFLNGAYADRAVLLMGQDLVAHTNFAGARDLLQEFATIAPTARLVPEIELAIAATWEQQGDWTNAIARYDLWLSSHTSHEAQPGAEFYRARAMSYAGLETNAFNEITNLITRYPTNHFAALARLWLADYYFQAGNYLEAETYYKLVFENTNLMYQARLMAGRAAFSRQGYSEATNHFVTLANDNNCPAPLRAQALYAYGDTLISQTTSNKIKDYIEALHTYEHISTTYTNMPEGVFAMLAWGAKANCLILLGSVTPLNSADWGLITNGYLQVLQSPYADATARSIAAVGLGEALEKQAGNKANDERAALLKLALRQYANVIYGEGFLRPNEKPDAFWTKEAGMKAARLSEKLNRPIPAQNVYLRLKELFPFLQVDDKVKALEPPPTESTKK
jgi:TolA-binding protein